MSICIPVCARVSICIPVCAPDATYGHPNGAARGSVNRFRLMDIGMQGLYAGLANPALWGFAEAVGGYWEGANLVTGVVGGTAQV